MPVMRPEKANVVPTDLGTKSIAEVNAVWEKLKGPASKDGYIRPDDFSKLTNEERVKAAERGRMIGKDRYSILRLLAKNMVLLYAINKGVRWVLEKVLAPSNANLAAKLLILVGLYNRWGAWSRLSDKPYRGPALVPFFGALLSMGKHRNTMHNFLLDMERTADFETLEIPVPMSCFISLMDPRDREYVLKTNPWNYLKNRDDDPMSFERIFSELLGRGIFGTDGLEWMSARKIASHMFSGTALRTQMEAAFNRHADRMLLLLKTSAANKHRVVDIQDLFQSAVFDAFCEIAFGLHPNCVETAIEGTQPQFLVSFDRAQMLTAYRVFTPPITWMTGRIVGSILNVGEEAELARHVKLIDDYIYNIIDARLQEEDISSRNDLLSLYIQYSRAQKEPFTREDYRDIIANFMIAGRDTTSCTLTYAIKFLAENPAVLKRVEEEGLFELGSGKARNHGDRRTVTWEESRSVPYADAVINEILRLAPPVGDDMRICVTDDVLPSGHKVRAGTRVGFLNTAIGRDPALWSDPEKFEPERWMKYDANGAPMPLKRVDEYVHPIFYAGRRLCLGKDMARFESIVFMSKLFEELEFEPQNVAKETIYTMTPVMFIQGGLPCKIKTRKPL